MQLQLIIPQLVGGLSDTPAFRFFYLNDRNPLGGRTKVRCIGAPNDAMRQVHARLVSYLRGQLRGKLPYATGGVRGCSVRHHVWPHRRHRYWFMTDITGAYNHVQAPVLARLLHELNPLRDTTEDWLAFLTKYCLSEHGGIVTGGPASVDLFNFYADRLLDTRIGALCEQWSVTYTRYLDDLTFTASEPIGHRKRSAIMRIMEDAGLPVSHRKTEVYDLRRRRHLVVVGIGVEYGGRMYTPRSYTRMLASLLNRALRGEPINPQEVHGRMGLVRWLNRTANRTEQKLLDLYATYCRSLTLFHAP